jgi:hypothetical protein
MEIYAMIVDSRTNKAVPGASVTRLYPNGARYSDDTASDASGRLDIRVPDRTYSAVAHASGYVDAPVNLSDALHARPDLPKIIRITPEVAAIDTGDSAAVTDDGGMGTGTILLVAGVGAFLFRKQLAQLFR